MLIKNIFVFLLEAKYLSDHPRIYFMGSEIHPSIYFMGDRKRLLHCVKLQTSDWNQSILCKGTCKLQMKLYPLQGYKYTLCKGIKCYFQTYFKKHQRYICKKNFFPVISMEAIIHSGWSGWFRLILPAKERRLLNLQEIRLLGKLDIRLLEKFERSLLGKIYTDSFKTERCWSRIHILFGVYVANIWLKSIYPQLNIAL